MTNNRKNATQQATPRAGKGGVIPPKHAQFGQPGGNKQNPNGLPKRFHEIRREIAKLLDPNLTIEDYQKIYEGAKTESGLRAVFAEAVIKKDIKTIFEMINQAMGKPKETIEAIVERKDPYDELTTEELRKLAGK